MPTAFTNLRNSPTSGRFDPAMPPDPEAQSGASAPSMSITRIPRACASRIRSSYGAHAAAE